MPRKCWRIQALWAAMKSRVIFKKEPKLAGCNKNGHFLPQWKNRISGLFFSVQMEGNASEPCFCWPTGSLVERCSRQCEGKIQTPHQSQRPRLVEGWILSARSQLASVERTQCNYFCCSMEGEGVTKTLLWRNAPFHFLPPWNGISGEV